MQPFQLGIGLNLGDLGLGLCFRKAFFTFLVDNTTHKALSMLSVSYFGCMYQLSVRLKWEKVALRLGTAYIDLGICTFTRCSFPCPDLHTCTYSTYPLVDFWFSGRRTRVLSHPLSTPASFPFFSLLSSLSETRISISGSVRRDICNAHRNFIRISYLLSICSSGKRMDVWVPA